MSSSLNEDVGVAPFHWRPMRESDLPAVSKVAALVHPDYPEKDAVFAERLRLYPAGTHVLIDPAGAIAGYVLSHPWPYASVPALDSLLGELPGGVDNFYIHDVALLPEARGRDAGRAIAATLADHARGAGFKRQSLVSISGTQAYWERQGFSEVARPELAAKLASYDPSARYMSRAL